MAQSDSDDFELVDPLDVAKQIVSDKKPDLTQIRTWLSPTSYIASSSEYSRHLSSQAPGTGEWIRETSQFQQWHSSDHHGSIWIKAVPGAGKSVVAASMVDSLTRKEAVPVLFFFFRQIIETNRTSRSLLRDWLAQLLPSSEILQVSLWDLIEAKKALETISTEQLWKLLLSALRGVERAYCIVDALDEMDLDEDFLARLNTIGSFRPGAVKVLMTSRPKQYLQRAMKDPQVIHVALEEELVKRDISVFVDQRVSRLGHLSSDSRNAIQKTICERSQGLFLYARLMLDQLSQSVEAEHLDEDLLRDMVAKLPIGLEEMYNRMLFEHATSSGTHQDIQVLILQLVTQSARPLRLIEIAKAIEACHGQTVRNSKDIVRTACGPLLEIMEDEVVQILHHSFTEFLLDVERLQTGPIQFPVIDPTRAHRSIAITCLARLQGDAFNEFRPDEKDDEEDNPDRRYYKNFDFQPVFLKYPLVEYAARKWTYHAKHYDVDDEGFFAEMNQFCDPKKPWFNAWLRLTSHGSDSSIAPRKATLLHVAAAFGLTSWAESLVKHGADLDALDSTKNTPLFWASQSGHAPVVEGLLKAGAKPDLDGYDGLKPLHVAAARNHWEVVKLLLAAGVSPTTPKTRDIGRRCGNAATSVGHSPLRYASQSGHVETVVEMLPYIPKAEDLVDALCWAAQGGYSKLVAAILEHSSVDPNGKLRIRHDSVSVTTGGQTALILAAQALDTACVRILLDKGADARLPSTRDQRSYGVYRSLARKRPATLGGTALHKLAKANVYKESEAAASEILDMLVAAGADLEARDHHGNTPLLSTVGGRRYSGDEHIAFQLLLAAGADPFAVDDDGETLLHKACQGSPKTDVASKLLELEVRPSQPRSSDGATPLHAALGNIYCPVEMIKLLVSHGADVNAADAEGNTPILCTCKRSGSKEREITSELISLGADVNAQNHLGQTCLHLFRLATQSYNHNETQLQETIKAGADVELRDRDGKTVLLYTISKSDEEMVEALLRHSSPSLTARTYRFGKSALHLAIHARNPLKMIQILIDHGADPTWTDNDGNTLLHEAAARFEGFAEDFALVERLIALGVPRDARNCRRRTALHVVRPNTRNNHSSREKTFRQTLASVFLRHEPTINLDVKDIDGYTPLHLAAAVSESHTFNLLQAGASISVKAYDGRTPLHCAARARQCGIISMLLHHTKGADSANEAFDINVKDKEGRTPLHDACRSGRPESVRILLDAGADIHQEDNKHHTPLMVCSEFVEEDKLWSSLNSKIAPWDEFRPAPMPNAQTYGTPQDILQHSTARVGPIVSMLMDAGAEVPGGSHGSVVKAAVGAKCVSMVAAIRSKIPGTSTSFEEEYMMFNTKKAQEVLETYTGHGPIQHPAKYAQTIDDHTMDALLERGVDFTKVEGDTALGVFAALGLTEKMSKVSFKADVLDDPSFCDEVGRIRPLLQVACDRPVWNMEMVKLLVNQGQVDVDAHQQVKEKDGYRETGRAVPGPTALHVLAKGEYWWQVEAIKFLAENGAEVDCLDEQGRTPLDIASTSNHYSSVMAHGFFRPQCCEMLLKLGANPNRINKEGLVPLNHARSDEDIVKVLLRHGADVNVGTKGVLMSAIEAGDIGTLSIYLKNGADCNIPDSSTDSSYDLSSHKSVRRRYPLLKAALPPTYGGWDSDSAKVMINLLLAHGAKVDHAIRDEETLIHYVFRYAPTSILRSFIDKPDIDFNTKDQKGRTVFMAACESNVDHETRSGIIYIPHEEEERLKKEYTPAYLALSDSELHGASLDYLATDNEGKHIINYLLPKWSDKIAKRFLPIPGVRDLLGQKDNAGFSPLHRALKALQITASSTLIDEGNVDVLEPDPNGDTALHHTHRCHYTSWIPRCQSMIDRFLNLGGNINARNNTGETALHAFLACSHPSSRYHRKPDSEEYDPFDLFITHKADFKAVKNDGETALHVVARRVASRPDVEEEDCNAKWFTKLVELGCDPLQEDNAGRTALDVAASMGNEGILKLYQRKKT